MEKNVFFELCNLFFMIITIIIFPFYSLSPVKRGTILSLQN